MSERMTPYHCPYCGDENLRPHEAAHGSWECRACLRAFSLKFVGLLRPASNSASESDGLDTSLRSYSTDGGVS